MLLGRLLKLRHPLPRRRLRDVLAERAPSRPGDQPFASFFERERIRRERARQRRRVALLSIAAHLVILGALGLWSLWRAEEMYAGSVPVRLARALDGAEGARRDERPPPARTNAARVTGLRLTVGAAGARGEQVAPTPGGEEQVDETARAYLTRLQLELLRPHLALPAGTAAPVRSELTLRLAIARDGRLVDASVKAPCPRAELCAALLAAARAAAPYPPHAQGAPDDGVWHVSVPVAFAP